MHSSGSSSRGVRVTGGQHIMQTSHAYERRLAMTSGTLSVRVCSERQLLEHGHCEDCRFSAALLKVRFHVAVMSFSLLDPEKRHPKASKVSIRFSFYRTAVTALSALHQARGRAKLGHAYVDHEKFVSRLRSRLQPSLLTVSKKGNRKVPEDCHSAAGLFDSSQSTEELPRQSESVKPESFPLRFHFSVPVWFLSSSAL